MVAISNKMYDKYKLAVNGFLSNSTTAYAKKLKHY